MHGLRIICFNIHGGRSLGGTRDLSRINRILDLYNVDIAVFQEVETRQSRGGALGDVFILAGPGRPHHHAGPVYIKEDGWYGNLIVSRHPFVRTAVHNLETDPRLEPRSAVDALIDTPVGKIRVIGTHLSLAGRERFLETQNLVKLIDQVEENEKNPVLLLGDFNEWRERSRLLTHLNRLLIALPLPATFPSFFPVFRLDRVWHDAPHLRIKAGVLNKDGVKKLSDHLPLLIEIG